MNSVVRSAAASALRLVSQRSSRGTQLQLIGRDRAIALVQQEARDQLRARGAAEQSHQRKYASSQPTVASCWASSSLQFGVDSIRLKRLPWKYGWRLMPRTNSVPDVILWEI
ncbi:hypothetical protein PR202_gb13155 [Eleusine coracana subsp. coracana]|uniref:Uncharacterized protein n=1 Tax=Eleusine coracana subsp. coracana TaxID=191504 RepID=A0AAV5ES30_ELECO|nr:hypothetical protein PR202_gb13155 [Eleusine coracana subsp. coracana]